MTAPTEPSPGRRCPRCEADLAPDQDWCLECGHAATTRIVPTPNWRLALAAAACVLVLLVAGGAIGFIAASGNGKIEVRTTFDSPPTAVPSPSTPGAPTTTSPTATPPPTASTPTAPAPGATSTPTTPETRKGGKARSKANAPKTNPSTATTPALTSPNTRSTR